MKRSEMIALIEKELTDFLNVENGYEEYGPRNADLLLKRLEDAGMKPPKSGEGERYCRNYDGSYTYPIYKWEDEEQSEKGP
jgi:hypothetical protein